MTGYVVATRTRSASKRPFRSSTEALRPVPPMSMASVAGREGDAAAAAAVDEAGRFGVVLRADAAFEAPRFTVALEAALAAATLGPGALGPAAFVAGAFVAGAFAGAARPDERCAGAARRRDLPAGEEEPDVVGLSVIEHSHLLRGRQDRQPPRTSRGTRSLSARRSPSNPCAGQTRRPPCATARRYRCAPTGGRPRIPRG